ncbi:MAG TPA: hypothetical protein VFZ10_24200 [Geminicoccaceae bacterium]
MSGKAVVDGGLMIDLSRGGAGLGAERGHAFALIEDRERGVQALLDRAMLACQRPSYHPLTNARTTTIAAADLPRFIEACGHEPRILDLDASGIAVT